MWYLGLSFRIGDRNGRRSVGVSAICGLRQALSAVLGHADRREPMRDYCLGLLMPIARKVSNRWQR
jgi:SRSO17 transposase